ncbi:MAG: hypothetical protein V4721_06235 [Bacteroidota bacterium]
MNKRKELVTTEPVRIGAEAVISVRKRVAETRQTIRGFIELAIEEKIEREGKPKKFNPNYETKS